MAETYELKIDVIEDNKRLLFLPENGECASTVLSSAWFGAVAHQFSYHKPGCKPQKFCTDWHKGFLHFIGLNQIFGDAAYPADTNGYHSYLTAFPLTAGDKITVTFNDEPASNTLQRMKWGHERLVSSLQRYNLVNSSQPTITGIPVIDLENYQKDALPFFKTLYHPSLPEQSVRESIRLPY